MKTLIDDLWKLQISQYPLHFYDIEQLTTTIYKENVFLVRNLFSKCNIYRNFFSLSFSTGKCALNICE